MKLYITERDIRKLVLNTLTEAALSIDDVYNKYYQSIDRDVFNAAVAADPTSYNQGKVVKVGNFVKWMLKLYSNNSWKPGDSYETKDLLSKFIKYKSKLPIEKRDINRFNSVSELYNLIQTLEGQGVKSQTEIKREGAEVVYEDSEWKIVIPHTEEASCIYGANTKWCTAGREDNMFDYYNKQGLLYININKQTGDKYQFHFKSGSFMDAEDEVIFPKEIGLSDGALEYYKSIGKASYILYDYVYNFYEGFAKVELDYKFNFINKQGELLWKGDIWFDYVNHFSEGFATVYIEGRGFNYINTQGELLWSEYKNFEYAYPFSEGFAKVELDYKFNFINKQGELLWKGDIWFDNVEYFFNGFAKVELEGKGWNFINTQGKLVYKGDKWFDWVGDFYEGFVNVKIDGKGWNFIDTKGELLWKEDIWFDDAWEFNNGFAWVKYNYKGDRYKLNTKGELYDKFGNRVNVSIQETKSGVIRLTENEIHKLVIKTLKEYLLK